MIRPTCISCGCKHVGQARVLALETRKGYSHFYWFALSHLAEAEDELVQDYPALADKVRAARKAWELEPFTLPDFKSLVLDIARAGGYDLDLEFEAQGKETLDDKHAQLEVDPVDRGRSTGIRPLEEAPGNPPPATAG